MRKKYEAEVDLCKEADQVVAIGPKLADTFSRSCGKGKVHDFTPGIVLEFADIEQDTGAPAGKEEQIKQMLFKGGISRSQLIVRSAKARGELVRQFCEADILIIIMK